MSLEGFLPVRRDLLSANSPTHPSRSGAEACPAFAWIDLGGMARFAPGDGLAVGELRASETFLARRWQWTRGKVRGFLKALEAEGRISRRPPTNAEKGARIGGGIAILNYQEDFTTPARLSARLSAHDNVAGRTAFPDSRPDSEPGSRPEVEEREEEERREKKNKPGSRRSATQVSVSDWIETVAQAIRDGPTSLLPIVADLKGLDESGAAWLCERTAAANAEEDLCTPDANAYDLAAGVLHDMRRKRVTWSPRRQSAWTVAAVRVGTDKTGHGYHDGPEVEAVERIYGSQDDPLRALDELEWVL